MINSIKQIATVKAEDLPPTFDIRVGNIDYPFEIHSMDRYYVYMIDTMHNQIVNILRSEDITILIPDTMENARFDLELAFLRNGLI